MRTILTTVVTMVLISLCVPLGWKLLMATKLSAALTEGIRRGWEAARMPTAAMPAIRGAAASARVLREWPEGVGT